MIDKFEEQLQQDLQQFLQSMKEIDERLPECPDVEEKWEEIVKAYIPDGIREFNDFPSASLGWMMYIGMAVAKFWDAEWEIYSKKHPILYDGMERVLCPRVHFKLIIIDSTIAYVGSANLTGAGMEMKSPRKRNY
jgi:phosphatidylserine/phosphatidylglycerophosphate/cardiolipin synthase-like enzyme